MTKIFGALIQLDAVYIFIMNLVHEVKFEGQGHRTNLTVTGGKCWYGKVVGATSGEGFPVDTCSA